MSASPERVLVVVEQLRRRVPGGIGSYAEGLLYGLWTMAGQGSPLPAVTLLASRAPRRGGPKTAPPGPSDSRAPRRDRLRRGADPLPARGWPLTTVALPGPVLTRAWDHGLLRAPAGFDLLHATSFALPSRPRGAGSAGANRRPALTVAVQDLLWRDYPEATTRRGRRWHERSVRRVVAEADALIASAPSVAERLRAEGARQVVVVPPGSDHLPAADGAAAAALLAEHGVGGPFLLSVGTLEPRKNLDRLVRAYHSVQARLPEPWPLVVVGPSGWGGTDRDLAGAPSSSPSPSSSSPPSGGAGRVVPVGRVAPAVLAALYERAQLLAYVPLGEGYGMPPMEAALRGTPVVASDQVPSVDPVPGVGAVAEVVDPTDVDAIAAGLLRVATDHVHAVALGRTARAVARERSWAAAAAAHVALWRSVVGW